jgi:hypothetical protein
MLLPTALDQVGLLLSTSEEKARQRGAKNAEIMTLLRIHRLCLIEDRANSIFEVDAESRGIKTGRTHSLARYGKKSIRPSPPQRQSPSRNDAFIDVEARMTLA